MTHAGERQRRARESHQAIDVEFDFLPFPTFRPAQPLSPVGSGAETDAEMWAARKCASVVNYCTFNILV
jgi:hypothetical protein